MVNFLQHCIFKAFIHKVAKSGCHFLDVNGDINIGSIFRDGLPGFFLLMLAVPSENSMKIYHQFNVVLA